MFKAAFLVAGTLGGAALGFYVQEHLERKHQVRAVLKKEFPQLTTFRNE